MSDSLHTQVLIVGSGPAGWTAAVYASRASLKTICITGETGGQLMTTSDVENYPGFPTGILGPDLMENMQKQAERFGTTVIFDEVADIDFESKPFKAVYGWRKDKVITADTIIIATGASANRLDIPGTRDGEFWQRGVSACATCDGANPIFREKNVFVIGGGDVAVEESIHMTKFAGKVHMVLRSGQFRASKIMAERAMNHPKIEVHFNSNIAEVRGSNVVESLTLHNSVSGEDEEIEAAGVFFCVGHTPNTKFLNGKLEMANGRYLAVGKHGNTGTSVEGVFAAGDVADWVYRQAVVAAGAGCQAALEAESYLSEHGLSN